MNIVFYYISKDVPVYAEYFMKSLRQFMPKANVVQVTDLDSPRIAGVDDVRRFETREYCRKTVNGLGFELLSKLNLRKMIFVDPDMMFTENIEYLFEGDFEISIATRMRKDHMKRWFKKKYPYNSLIVLKTGRFWKDCCDALAGFRASWYSNMGAVAKVVDSGKYSVNLLSGNLYNKVPQSETDFDRKAKVFHFKGTNRKEYMKPFYEKYINA